MVKSRLFVKSKALLARLLYLTHGILSVAMAMKYHAGHWKYCLLFLPVLALIAETVFMLKRKKWEFRYISPTAFLYITTVVPVIWIIEFDLFQIRLAKRDKLNITSLNTHLQKEIIGGGLFLHDIEVEGRKVCEIGLFIVLLIGRWLNPRGKITRGEFSTLLLGYVGTTSDILEILELFKEPAIKYQKSVTMAIILLYSVAMYQYCLVTTVTSDDMKMKVERKKFYAKFKKKNRVIPVSEAVIKNCVKSSLVDEINKTTNEERCRLDSSVLALTAKIADVETSKEQEDVMKKNERRKQLYQGFSSLFLQDGPFCILRLYLLVNCRIRSEMHLYFTCKNMVVIFLHLYRLLAMYAKRHDRTTLWDREEIVQMLRRIGLATMAATINERRVSASLL